MADTFEKRLREAKKRKKRELKAQRKQMRKEGVLGNDNTGLFPDGEQPRETVDFPSAKDRESPPPPPPPEAQ